jgi:hypothetical protein
VQTDPDRETVTSPPPLGVVPPTPMLVHVKRVPVRFLEEQEPHILLTWLPLVRSPCTHVSDAGRGAHIPNVGLVARDEAICPVATPMRSGACVPKVPHLSAEHTDQPGGAHVIDVVCSIRPALPTIETHHS